MPATPSNRKAVYTGVFDPIHRGHLDVIRRGSHVFDKLVVGVGINPEKTPFFSIEERVIRAVVEDNGPGIPEYAVDKVFDRFYSLPRPDTGVKSTGLGLSFVREIAHLHGGEITLTNRAEGGCRAVLVLPV